MNTERCRREEESLAATLNGPRQNDVSLEEHPTFFFCMVFSETSIGNFGFIMQVLEGNLFLE